MEHSQGIDSRTVVYITMLFYAGIYLEAGVLLGGKLSPFSDTSQNSTLEKQTLHKIQHE